MNKSATQFAASLVCLALTAAAIAQAPAPGAAPRQRPAPSLLVLTSPGYADGAMIPSKYAAAAGAATVSPELKWTGAPAGTQSFVLLMRDEEFAPGKRWEPAYHWVVFNIPASATGLPEGVAKATKEFPDGMIQPQFERGVGYVGPGAPGEGQPHHYTLSLYALDIKLPLGPEATIAEINKAMDGHILDKGFLVGRYHRAP